MTGPAALFAGDVSADLTMTIPRVPEPDEKLDAASAGEDAGGVAANAAVACAMADVPTRLVIAVGDDAAGEMVAKRLGSTGVDVSSQVRAGSTCRVVILIEPHGEKRLLLHPGVSMYPTRRQIEAAPLDGVGWAHTAVYDRDAAERLVERCRAGAIPWSLDLEPSTFPGGIAQLGRCLAGAAVVFCNARAMAALGEAPVARLFAMGVEAVVETRGAEGATLRRPTGCTSVPAPRGPVVDTTGAGDCLAGWFVAERLRAAAPEQALATAVLAATISCAGLGGLSSYPARREVESRRTAGAGITLNREPS